MYIHKHVHMHTYMLTTYIHEYSTGLYIHTLRTMRMSTCVRTTQFKDPFDGGRRSQLPLAALQDANEALKLLHVALAKEALYNKTPRQAGDCS